ncbi:hypothetical protein BXY66_1798 [Shimia isoporae]|uniref:Uncharacterized protein n=1 Tax=Shimia isoporae TaxID=647720 RepID=A0A4R1NPH0_9RHOB|nr:hypothetical protein [Shimia isoporae]TCL09741.1 hypothetical protein BXY66_1798 [Shimia isoporae]
MSDTLDARLLAAHAAGDKFALVSLYAEAAESAADDKTRGFYLTHAYVFALETGDQRAAKLHEILKGMGRD